ncbi:hypothetical protein I6I10_07355 [Corynebacterium glucuronolyticum]|uniref:Uncharacterized protein n=1 Tax=Corynebacterium glucuronolyticum TaxID=39791 RepID=A0A7T4BN78_9CORY|nr:hypothetical protein [Corynebacterium glucuronolyticum]QQB45354.1 hypothetical protein I6I10_07355 [Corynebacterium glucuronolyticum]WKD64030.1 hypothetical protein CGLUCO_08925 [Corynebacterium glucuronolyticum DSM 44120]SMB81504.1 hypothetical protein SAMN05660745_02432 [Corynebacterium glucuronolyticum]
MADEVTTVSSVWDAIPNLTVAEMLSDPTLLTDAFGERLDEFQAFDAFFEVKNVNSDIVPYRHATAAYLEDDPIVIPEGGEIPVSDPLATTELLHATIKKYGIGLRVTWEQIKDDRRDEVADELTAKANTVSRHKKLEALAALKAAPVQELQVSKPWDAGGDVKGDLLDAQALILDAKDKKGDPLMYEPAVVWASPTTIMDIQRSKSMDDLYNGNMASAHPLFQKAGTLPSLFSDSIAVIKDFAIPHGELWMGSNIKAGKLAQREDEYTSPFYAEDGGAVDVRYGKRQTARANYSHRRAFYVQHPLSVVHMTGLAG